MHGPPLTPQEAMTSVARRVERLEAQGFDRDHAIRFAAAHYGIEPEKARWCVSHASAGWSADPCGSDDRFNAPRRKRGGRDRRSTRIHHYESSLLTV